MRIVLLNSNPSWGGGEQWFLDASSVLTDRGHEVLVLARAGSKLSERVTVPQASVAEVKRALPEFGPDVVLCNDRRAVRIALRARGPWSVVLRRGVERRLSDNVVRRWTWRKLSHIIANSDSTRTVISESLPWFPVDRITRIYNPVMFEPLPNEPAGDSLRIVTASRLVPRKGIDVLLRALVTVKRPWTLEIAGSGRDRQSLEALARGFGDRCRFLGHVEDMRPVYARADVVVIPSYHEGFCYTAIEAQLARLNVIASAAGSLRETARDGILFPPGDVAALARGIEGLKSGVRDDLRAIVRERFAPARIYDQLDELLARIATQPAVG